jgi:site-specific DNA-methyltransferase (adenine-specific)
MKPYYEHAGITIYHGDCREIQMPADALVSDPPYGIGFKSMRRRSSNPQWCRDEDKIFAPIAGDDAKFDPRHLLGYPKIVLFGANYFCDLLPISASWLIWDKKVDTGSDDSADCEMAWSNLGGPARMFRHLWRGICRWGEENVSTSGGRLHPNQKPVALMRWVLNQCKLSPGQVVFDPYMGSGTTLLAAKRDGYKAIGCELDEKYCEVAAKRLSQEVLDFTSPISGGGRFLVGSQGFEDFFDACVAAGWGSRKRLHGARHE